MTRRRTRCPQSRPLYRHEDLPATLATATMLRRLRRVVAPAQAPAGSLLYGGNRYAPLYDIGASVPMAPLPPAKLAAWTARHHCARCAASADARFGPHVRTAPGGRRLCPGCHDREAQATWRVRQLTARAAAVAWAHGIVANPAAVVLAQQDRSDPRMPFRVYAATVGGELLVDAVIAPQDPYPATVPGAAVPAEAVAIESLHERLRDIARQRLVVWAAGPDGLAYQYTAWLGETTPRWSYRHASIYGVPQRLAPGSPRDHAETILDLLRRMARDEHPTGPPACPVLADTGVTPCGVLAAADGLCSKHGPCPG